MYNNSERWMDYGNDIKRLWEGSDWGIPEIMERKEHVA